MKPEYYGEVNYKTGELLLVFKEPPAKDTLITADYVEFPDDAVTLLGNLAREDDEQ